MNTICSGIILLVILVVCIAWMFSDRPGLQ